jgi:membrane-bound lytic murein transglycosylase B
MTLRLVRWLALLLAAALTLPAAADVKAKPKPKPGSAKTTKAAKTNPSTKASKSRFLGTSYGPREDVREFATTVAERRGIDRAGLLKALTQARRVEAIQRLIMPPPAGTTKDWGAYRDRFIESRRITAGAAFWQANEDALQRAEQRYGVPAAIVVGIIGVETFFGRVTGGFRVIDALATLSFDFPAGRKDRSAFFRTELEEFLVMCQREGLDPQAQKGSFAGAMGLAQFMPGSINRHAVDFDGNGHIDMAGSSADAIGSVAHYLAESGWQRDMPTHYDVAVPVDSAERAMLLGPDILPSFSAAQFGEHGAVLAQAGRGHDGPLALVELQNGDRAPSYIAGTQNFYAVTRYNWSSYYALAVIQLGEAVALSRAANPPAR